MCYDSLHTDWYVSMKWKMQEVLSNAIKDHYALNCKGFNVRPLDMRVSHAVFCRFGQRLHA